ncbi:hypothetical protein GF324_02545 [bacterium]|nr:hypothetical protein [bacterium]
MHDPHTHHHANLPRSVTWPVSSPIFFLSYPQPVAIPGSVAASRPAGASMKRRLKSAAFLSVIALLLLSSVSAGVAAFRSPEQAEIGLKTIANRTDRATLHALGETPGGRTLALLEIGAKGDEVPGILVVANMTGDAPLASEAALALADSLAGPWEKVTDELTWYIYPCGNPDGYASLFGDTQDNDFRNERPFNDDVDRATDEDGPDDLNGDGMVTLMRQRHLEGEYAALPDRPYMVKADPTKGDRVRYRLFTEGLDNDGDGQYNEDGTGGVNPGHNFPHRWQMHTDHMGLWSGSEVESRELMRFTFARPSIAMVLVLGRTNTLRDVPDSDREADILEQSFGVPGWLARRTGLERGSKMTVGDMLPLVRDALDRPALTPSKLLGWLSEDAATEPHPGDLAYQTALSERYMAFLDSAGVAGKRLDSPPSPAGSVEEWAYYQYGVPAFALDFWTPPLREDTKTDSADTDTTAAPDSASDSMDEEDEEVEDDRRNEEHDALLAYDPESWLEWTPFDHPTLGPVEIGGKRPRAGLMPREEEIDALLGAQLPFLLALADARPRLEIDSTAVTKRADGVYELDAWFCNAGVLPYPAHHGVRTERPVPIAATLDGIKAEQLLEGRARMVIGLLEGGGGSERVRWVIAGRRGSGVTITAGSPAVGTVSRTIRLEGGAR